MLSGGLRSRLWLLAARKGKVHDRRGYYRSGLNASPLCDDPANIPASRYCSPACFYHDASSISLRSTCEPINNPGRASLSSSSQPPSISRLRWSTLYSPCCLAGSPSHQQPLTPSYLIPSCGDCAGCSINCHTPILTPSGPHPKTWSLTRSSRVGPKYRKMERELPVYCCLI